MIIEITCYHEIVMVLWSDHIPEDATAAQVGLGSVHATNRVKPGGQVRECACGCMCLRLSVVPGLGLYCTVGDEGGDNAKFSVGRFAIVSKATSRQ